MRGHRTKEKTPILHQRLTDDLLSEAQRHTLAAIGAALAERLAAMGEDAPSDERTFLASFVIFSMIFAYELIYDVRDGAGDAAWSLRGE